MPELPEVETVRKGLHTALVGRVFKSIHLLRPDLRTAMPNDLSEKLPGRRVVAVERRAKYLVIRTDGPAVVSHLGMTGRWTTSPSVPSARATHDHVVWLFADGSSAVFNDPRRFGILEWLTEHTFAALGPEPLGADFTAEYLTQALRGRSAKVKALIMDQRVVVGVGNIYAAEALHRARISPRRAAGRISRAEATRLVETIRQVLGEAIEQGGSSISDYRQVSGDRGGFQDRFLVYDREGQPCPSCPDPKATIKNVVIAGRSSFYCAKCQR